MLGGILFVDRNVYYYIHQLTKEDLRFFNKEQEQRINQAEAYAALLMIQAGAEHLEGHDCTLYVDNSAAEGTLTKAYSKSPFLTAIAGEFWTMVMKHNIGIYVDRVPTSENITDPLSRGELLVAKLLGATKLKVVMPSPSKWGFLVNKEGTKRHKAVKKARVA